MFGCIPFVTSFMRPRRLLVHQFSARWLRRFTLALYLALASSSVTGWCLAQTNQAPANALPVNSDCFRIEVIDQENNWPVPLVELRTVHEMRLVTDNAGVIAIDEPELMNRETFFFIESPNYQIEPDGFGLRGIRLTPKPGQTKCITVKRILPAKRLGRLTGSGLLAESQRTSISPKASDPQKSEQPTSVQHRTSVVVGCDSVQMAMLSGVDGSARRMFWAWGDTNFIGYPLGNFDMTGALTDRWPVDQLKPPIQPTYDYFMKNDRQTRGVAPIAGKGPTWLTNIASLPDKNGQQHLVAIYRKIEPPMSVYEVGLCQWSDDAGRHWAESTSGSGSFQIIRKLWSKSETQPKPPTEKLVPLQANGHSVIYRDDQNRTWLLHGNPLPACRSLATFEDWSDPEHWETTDAPSALTSADGQSVKPHSGSIAWSAYRQRWVTVFMQEFGKPSPFGELWYAEAKNPLGTWGPAVKILSHANYTFYNPRLWGDLSDSQSPVLLFEGTYTQQFAHAPVPTPRYDYNQILYRLDLDDPALQPARSP